jgi:outer membrane protein assembly factor BamB
LGNDGVIYWGGGTNLYALNADGTLKWRFMAGGQIHASPALGPDGTVYFGAFDSKLYALTPAGTKKWSFITAGRIYSSPAVDTDGTIYFGSDDYSLYALRPDGSRKWAFATGSYVRSSPSIGADGTIYFGSWDNQLYALSRDGHQLWAFETGRYVYSSPALGVDGTIYVGSADDKLYAVTPEGAKKWEFATGSHIYASPALASDGTVYIGSWDDRLYALSPGGTQKWSFATSGLVQSSPAIDTNGVIYFGSDEKKVYAINPDGSKKWSFTTGSLVRSSPVISPDGTLYVGSEDGRFYAIRSGGSGGLAVSPWPMFRSNPRHQAKVLLVITQQPQSQMVIVNRPVTFKVEASGPGPLQYQWRFNGTNVSEALTNRLTLTSVQPTSGGEYAVAVSDPAETVLSLPAMLTVVVAPDIVSQPQSQTVALGTNAVFTVAAASVAPLTYQWYHQGTNVNLPTAIAPTLTLPEVQSEQEGDYTVVVSNSAGAVTSAVVTLTVVSPPLIVVPPQDQVGAIGTNISFTVAAASSVPMQFQWRFNGTNIPSATTSNLVLRNVQPPSGGNYSVVVSNMAGAVTSPAALLTVTLPPLITTQPGDQIGVAGGTANLSVAASSAGPLSYQWYFEETNLTMATANSNNLTLKQLRPDQAGTYSVVVSNVAGSVTSAPVRLTVLVPPAIDRQPLSQTGSLGASVTFSVNAHGSSPLDYNWQFQGANLAGATNPTLCLNRITAAQAGTYSVVVTNAAGEVTSHAAALIVLPRRSLWERIKGWF